MDLTLMFKELLGPLGLPGAIAAVLVAVHYGAQLADRFAGRKHGNGHGHAGSWQASVMAAVANLTTAVAQLGQTDERILTELAEVRRIVERSELKQEQLLCREDAVEIAEKNRHAIRDLFQVAGAKLDVLLARGKS